MEGTAPNPQTAAWTFFEMRMGFLAGALIGALLCGWNGLSQGKGTKSFGPALLGGVLGGLGMLIGMQIGGQITYSIFGRDFYMRSIAEAMAGRAVIGTFTGGALGLAIGITTFNSKRMVQGLIGGLLGGLIGGVLFDPVGVIFGTAKVVATGGGQETGALSRGILFTLLGIAVGLFIGAIEQISKSAWIRLRLGRNEGREWILDKQISVIGRSEVADIPLFGDNSVAPNHASIVRQGDVYWIFDAGTPAGVFVNGQKVTQMALAPNSLIQIGSLQLEFLVKKGSTVGRAAEQLRSQPQIAPVAPVAVTPAPVAPSTPVPTMMQAPLNPTVAIPAAQASLPKPKLRVLTGPMTGQMIDIFGVLEIGREQSCGLSLGYDVNISRKHAVLEFDGSLLKVRDLGSTNGTFLNGNRVTESVISPGDQLKIGSSTFEVVFS